VRLAPALLLGLCACAGSATRSPAAANVAGSALVLGLAPCSRVAATDSLGGTDWRETTQGGLSFCVPAHWRKGNGHSWYGDEIAVGVTEIPNARLDYPVRNVARERTWGFEQDTVDGRLLEMWAEKAKGEVSSPRFDVATGTTRTDAHRVPYYPGYSSYGLYRDLNVLFRASVKRSADVELTRKIFRTLHVTPTDGTGRSGGDRR
jgi:hypothetical protein